MSVNLDQLMEFAVKLKTITASAELSIMIDPDKGVCLDVGMLKGENKLAFRKWVFNQELKEMAPPQFDVFVLDTAYRELKKAYEATSLKRETLTRKEIF